MKFEWDAEKAAANIEKHGISFVAATAVFDDPARIEENSTRPEYGEMRVKAIGRIGMELVVVVVYTDREDKCRIISARVAGKDEREAYNKR